MDTRFAGSQRLGERRRRRLAAESDDPTLPDSAPEELTSPDGVRRVPHPAIAEPPRDAVTLPLTGLVPLIWWKYLPGGLALLLAGATILALGWYESAWSTNAGLAMVRLFSLRDSTAARWYSALLLNLSAQLAALIWWGRSRSLKDFDGRYRLWRRIACVWLAFGFCAATGAHSACTAAILQLLPVAIPRIEVLAWLIPAAAMGLVLVAMLNREMSGCHVSRAVMFVAAACYAVTGTLRLGIGGGMPVRVQELLPAAAALLGHWCLFVSMWLHARHVIHRTADPSRTPRRRLRIPRPHFRLPGLPLAWRRSAVITEEVADSRDSEPRNRKRLSRKTVEADQSPSEAGAAQADRNEIDLLTGRGGHSAEGPSTKSSPLEDIEPLTIPPRHAAPPPSVARRPPDVAAPAAEDEARDVADEDESWTEPFAKPDMRGMSKKQRRKLMAELREKERAARRP